MSNRVLFGSVLAGAGCAIISANLWLPQFSDQAAEARARAAGSRGRAAARPGGAPANGVWANVGAQRDFLRETASAGARGERSS